MGTTYPFPTVALVATATVSAFVAALGAQPNEKDIEKIPVILSAKAIEYATGDDELQKLLKNRYNESVALTLKYHKNFLILGRPPECDPVIDAGRRLLKAGMELYDKPPQRIDFLKQMLEFADRVDSIVEFRKRQMIFEQSKSRVREFKLELQIEMLRAKKLAPSKSKR